MKKNIVSNERLLAFFCLYLKTKDKSKTMDQLAITDETFNRYMRLCKEQGFVTNKELKTLETIKNLNIEEIQALTNQNEKIIHRAPYKVDWASSKKVKFAAFSDTHFGSIYTNEDSYLEMLNIIEKENCSFVALPGDITEGMSNRPGHIYECNKLGYAEQKKYAIEMLKKINTPLYVIDGNHDRWFKKSNGARIVEDICENVPNAIYLGEDEGDIKIDNIIIKLWHGEDASSYAISYRLQQLVQSLSGGEKPSIILAGHVHKMGYFFIRNIHAVSTGCIQSQSKWMRGKRLAAHTGFWIIEFEYNNTGIISFTPKMYPFYK